MRALSKGRDGDLELKIPFILSSPVGKRNLKALSRVPLVAEISNLMNQTRRSIFSDMTESPEYGLVVTMAYSSLG